ncbi:MAG TPA: hypothetical protein PK079_21620 [Leptospiraceae bacterium]|nr:hypothetical protein [Leptospiraceae bacterium]HMW08104.1 hypothetical protein [Leptospiraceae bacterium]HMY33815.1 hypothetical protein [Leptospiraceae bacterium]HMZ65926.1 hypothetical protein [Leptospiraceae bacterium]HNA08852.1 hypothetical protein [Leptospiraceae bacterium]
MQENKSLYTTTQNKDILLAILIQQDKEELTENSIVEIFDPIHRDIIERCRWIHAVNKIICDPEIPLMPVILEQEKKLKKIV